jgi:molybdenum cofactor synthesis domain-containing protein
MFTVGIITVSDGVSRCERDDLSGAEIRRCLSGSGDVLRYTVVPDETALIAARLQEWADSGGIDVILTTGGTGLAPRDVTPEATLSVLDRAVPGLAEAMRVQTFALTPLSMLSRAVTGVRGQCLIINLPGSPKAVRECLEVVLPVLPHALGIIKGEITLHTGKESGAH